MSTKPRLVNLNMRCHVCDKRFTLTDVYAVPQHTQDLVICPVCSQEAQPRDFDLPLEPIDKQAARDAMLLEKQLQAVERANPEQVRQFIFNGKPLSLVMPEKKKKSKPKKRRQTFSEIVYSFSNEDLWALSFVFCFDCDGPLYGRYQHFGSCSDCMHARYEAHQNRIERKKRLNQK